MHDDYWVQALDFIRSNQLYNHSFIAPVEFCVVLDNCVSYEWSYWHEISDYTCLIIHKGQLERLKNNYLSKLSKNFDYIFGNEVFNIFLNKKFNDEMLVEEKYHYQITNSSTIKKAIKISKNKQNILLVTANNNGNIGDDAITFAAFDMLQEVFPQAEVHIDKAPACKNIIKQMDLVVIGGGGVFYDNNFNNAQNYCQYFLYAHEAKVKSCAIGVGALGRRTVLGNELFKHALDLAEFIVVRDKISQVALTETIATSTKVYCKQDIAFTLQATQAYELKKQNEKPLLLFSLVDMKNRRNYIHYQQQQIPCMQMLLEYFEVKLLLQSKDDLALYNTLKNRFGLEIIDLGYANTRQVISLYQQCDLVITGRLHGFIFATLANVPVITVSTQKNASKLDILIKTSLPKCAISNISKHDYDKDVLLRKITQYFNDKNNFVASKKEVAYCQQQALEIKNILKREFVDS